MESYHIAKFAPDDGFGGAYPAPVNRPATIPTFVRSLGPFVFACLGFFVLSRIGSLAGLTSQTITPFWPAHGFGLALALSGRRSELLGLALGSFAAAYWRLDGPGACTVAISDTISAWLAAALYRRFEQSFVWLGPLRGSFGLFLAGAVGAALSAVCTGSTLEWLYALSPETAHSIRVNWFLGDLLGLVIAGPVCIFLHRWTRHPTRPSPEAVWRLLLTCALSFAAIALAVSFPEYKGLIFLLFLVPLVAKYRPEDHVLKISLLVTIVFLIAAVKQYGVWLSHGSPDENRLVLASFMSGMAVVWLVVSTEAAQKSRGVPLVIFVVACIVAARIYGRGAHLVDLSKAAQSEEIVARANAALVGKLENFVEALRPADFLLGRFGPLSLPDWKNYVTGLNIEKHYAGLRGIGVVYPVRAGQIERYFAQCRARQIPLTSLWSFAGGPAAPAADPTFEHLVFTLFHSTNPQARSIGLDLTTDPIRHEAALLARDTREPQLTRRLWLLQDKASARRGSGFVVLYPVYHPGAPVATPEQRRAGLICWVLGGFTMESACAGLLDGIAFDGNFSVYEGTEARPEARVFHSMPGAEVSPGETVRHVTRFLLAHQPFTVVWNFRPEKIRAEHLSQMLLSLGIVLAAALLSSLVLNLRNFSHRTEQQVIERTKQLELTNIKLRQQEAENHKLATVATEATNAIVVMDAEANIQWVNKSFVALYGYTLDEVRSRKIWDFLNGPETDQHAQRIKQDAIKHHTSFTIEVLHYTKDGRQIWVHTAWRSILGIDGMVTGHVAIQTDITARKSYEKRLEAATAVAEEANEAKSALIANVSHELRTPLNVIMGNLQLLLAGTFGQVEEAQVAPLRRIEESSQHLLLLIGDLLDVSKVHAGMLELKIGPVNVTPLCDAALGMLRSSTKFKHLELQTDYRHRTDLIAGDELRLKQVLINLLSNAVKFTPDGGTITLRVEETGQPAELLFHVIDTGAGIHRDDQERIFLEFEQGEHVGHSGGTGLGLPIARRLAVMHGGALTVVSELGRGSTFTLRLPILVPESPPVTESPALAAPETPRAQPIPPHEALILAVDDFDINLEILCMYLQGEGYQVIQAMSGEEAIKQAHDHQPHLILMDVKMSGIDGLEAIRRLKADPTTRDIPIISLTAFAGAADTERCFAAGAADYVSKPIDFPELGRKVARHLTPRS